ncbi:MAG: GNAT family N-acetyltransferase [Verrucomicrobia bacterium]|nr:GNAT family N-acetyltransferase [Verrucomicrobiota bacterium]
MADPVPSSSEGSWPTKIPGLTLRELQPADAFVLARIVDRHRGFLEPALAWVQQNSTVEALQEFLQIAARETARGNVHHAVILLETHPIGMVGLHGLETTESSARLTYWLEPSSTGHGYAAAAVGAWIGVAFQNFSLTMIESRVAPANTPSRRLCRRLGFTEVGLLSAEEWSGEDFSDVIVYRLTREDWRSADASRSQRLR